MIVCIMMELCDCFYYEGIVRLFFIMRELCDCLY